jgi:hypothetical protein
MRLPIIDGMRGHLLIGMMIAHLSFTPGLEGLRNAHHKLLIGMYDAEFFVFISGLLVGYLVQRKCATQSVFHTFVLGRLKTIYGFYLLSALPFLLLVGSPTLNDVVSVLTVQSGGAYSDILPLYLYCFSIVLPLYAIFRGSRVFLFISSAVLYIASQFSFQSGFFGLSSSFVVFDAAAWQFLFVIAFTVGGASVRITNLLTRLSPRLNLALIALLTVTIIATRHVGAYPTPVALPQEVLGNWPRMHLHPFFLCRILAVCGLVTLVFYATHPLVSPLGKLLRAYFSLKFIRTIGSYSIQMFLLHVYLMALFSAALPHIEQQSRLPLALFLIAVFIAIPNIYAIFGENLRSGFENRRLKFKLTATRQNS